GAGTAGTLVAGVTYLPFGMASGWTAHNGAVYQRTIDQDGRITGLALPAGDTIALSYDAASRITGIAETGFPAQNFSYDALDRLATNTSGAATQTYTFDANGNRASYLDNATPPVSLTYNYDMPAIIYRVSAAAGPGVSPMTPVATCSPIRRRFPVTASPRDG
ncbi:MAG: hypothetical protein ACREDH_04170, partial [Methylocella sp.]